jgi:hypothetical protein
LRTEFRGFREDLRDLKSGTAKRLDDLEKDIDRLNFWRGIFQGIGLVTVAIILPAIAWLFVSFDNDQNSLDARLTKTINTSLINYSLIKN